jgi:acetylornithine deacetylase/succinyl-diaminopimelate desuccinylase-like protein
MPTVPQLADIPAIRKALARLSSYEDWITDRQVEFCAIPAPSFEEQPRAEYFQRQFTRLKLENVHIDAEGNVLAEIPGGAPKRERRVVALTAHLDTVFPRTTSVTIRRERGRLLGPGVTDNGAGLSALLAIARVVRECGIETRDTLLFVGNVGEEGQGNLRGMKHLLNDAALRENLRAVLVVDGPGAEHVVTQGLGSRRFEVVVEGPGGHSWRDFGTVNPVHAVASAIGRIAALPVSGINPPGGVPQSTCSVTEIRAGTSVNSIPTTATMKVDIRSSAEAEMARLAEVVREIAQVAAQEESRRASRGALTVTINDIGHRPAAILAEDTRILAAIREVDAHLGIQTRLEQSSTDANVPFALGIEAVCIGAGGRGGGTHSAAEWFDPEGRLLGLQRILLTVLMLAGEAV